VTDKAAVGAAPVDRGIISGARVPLRLRSRCSRNPQAMSWPAFTPRAEARQFAQATRQSGSNWRALGTPTLTRWGRHTVCHPDQQPRRSRNALEHL